MSRQVLLSLILFALCSSLLLLPARGGASGIWPLFSYYASEERTEVEILGPLFTWTEEEQRSEWGIRPFVYLTNDPARELLRWEFVYPLGKYQYKEGDHKSYLVPFSLLRDEVTSSEPERREKASAFLTAFWGQTDEGEKYGGFFPIAGRLEERLGRDEINFISGPSIHASRTKVK